MNVENLVDSILSDQVQITDLNLEEINALVQYMREHIGTIKNDEYREALLILVNAIKISTENRLQNKTLSDWDGTIEASMARGNTYFELDHPVVQ